MGYCYTTGEKVNGRWKFLKCDGRSNKCAQDGGVIPNVPCDKDYVAKDCGEWCKKRKTAVMLVEQKVD